MLATALKSKLWYTSYGLPKFPRVLLVGVFNVRHWTPLFVIPLRLKISPCGLDPLTIDIWHFALNVPFSAFDSRQLMVDVLGLLCFSNRWSSLNVRCSMIDVERPFNILHPNLPNSQSYPNSRSPGHVTNHVGQMGTHQKMTREKGQG
jgi:hypothetical protein